MRARSASIRRRTQGRASPGYSVRQPGRAIAWNYLPDYPEQVTAERLAYAIEEGRYPLVTARATEHLNDPRAVDASYDKLEAILARQQPFALVFDMRGASSTPTRRRRFLDWCERNAEPLTRLLMASAIVARSSIERGFVTAGLWLSRPAPWPMRVFSDPHEAEAWALGQYAERASSKVVS